MKEPNVSLNRNWSKLSRLFCFRTFVLLTALLLTHCLHCYGQSLSGFERDRGRVMLSTIESDLKKSYYDPTFHGVDIDTRFKEADDKIKQATSLGQIFGAIAAFLMRLDDSHCFFVPPQRSYRTEYGWKMLPIGDKNYVIAVKPGSDADAKGLKPGDQIYAVDGVRQTRQNFWVFNYLYNQLQPRPAMRLAIVRPDGQQAQLEVPAKVKQEKVVKDLTGESGDSDIYDVIFAAEAEERLYRQRYVEMGDDLFIWKMPSFDLLKDKVDELADKFRNHKNLIIDLRGNGGGYEETLLRLIGNLFDRDVKVGDVTTRKGAKPLIAKTRGDRVFKGNLVVLIDSDSGSAAELLARVVQLEKRGKVIGDQSAGAVMRARFHDHQQGSEIAIFYGASITEADIIMTDGKSLEHVGVTPDEIRLPTATDLAAQKDPVLAYAASLIGVTITPEKAFALFPLEWRK
jgi:carboxyl-terminal processing protease